MKNINEFFFSNPFNISTFFDENNFASEFKILVVFMY